MTRDASTSPNTARRSLIATHARETVADLVAQLFDPIIGQCPDSALSYHEPDRGLIERPGAGAHCLSLRLTGQRGPLGELTLRRRRRYGDQELRAIEDIVSGVLPRLEAALTAEQPTPGSDFDLDTGVHSRATLERQLARLEPDIVRIVMIIADEPILPMSLWRRVLLQVAAVVPDPDRIYRCQARTMAVALNAAEARSDTFLAERIRLMVAAMKAALPAPTITVAIADARTGTTLEAIETRCGALPAGRNRVVLA